MPETSNEIKQELNRRGWTDTQIAVYTELRKRGYSHQEIQERIQKTPSPKTFTPPLRGEKERSFAEVAPESIPELVGGIAGGLAAPGFLPGVGLAGLFGGAGEAYKQIYQQAFRPEAAPQDPMEAARRIGMAGLRQSGYEVVGRGVARGVQKTLAPMAKRVVPELVEAGKTLGGYMGRKMGLSPAQVTRSRIIDTLEGIGEQSLTGSERVYRHRLLQKQGLSRFAEDISQRFGGEAIGKLTNEEIGELFLDISTTKEAAFRQAANVLYKNVDEITGAARVSLVSVKTFALNAMKIAEKRKGIGSTEAGDALLNKVLKLDNTVTFQEAQQIRSAFIDEIEKLSATKDKARGLAQQFEKLTDKAMEDGAGKLSGEAVEAWREANAFYRRGKDIFSNKFMKALGRRLRENPEIIIDDAFRPGKITRIKRIKRVVDKDTWKALKAGYVEKLFQESFDDEGIIVGKGLMGRLKKMGTPTLKEIFSPEELNQLQQFTGAAMAVQKPIGGSAGMLIQLTQASAGIGIVTGLAAGGLREGVLTGAGVFLIGPYALSRMITNPVTARWLIEGFRIPAGTPRATALATRIIGTAVKIQLERSEKPISDEEIASMVATK